MYIIKDFVSHFSLSLFFNISLKLALKNAFNERDENFDKLLILD